MTRQRILLLAAAYASHALQTPTTRIVKHSGVRATPVVDAAEAPAADMSDASAAALIAGTTVGAGVLALPAATAGAGFAASTAVLCSSWVFMAAAGLLVAEAAAAAARRTGEADVGFLATVRELLGDDVSRVTGATYAFLHYALLVAYAAQGGGLLAGAVGAPGSRGTCLDGACLLLSEKTHVFDVANRPWLLPFIHDRATSGPERELLGELMRLANQRRPEDRPSFAELLDRLDQFEKSHRRRA